MIMKRSGYIALLLAVVTLNACSDFLEKSPMSLTPEQYLTTEANVTSFAYGLYTNNFVTHGSYEWGTFQNDVNTDNMAHYYPNDMFAPGYWKVAESGGVWNSWGQMYQLNSFLNSVPANYLKGGIKGSDDLIRHAIGEVYFFRAWDYFGKLQNLGDLPIIKTVLPNDMEKLTAESKRMPRNEVARFILSDLDKALEYMMDGQVGGTNRLSKQCVHLFKSRVALYEGTWLKYFKGTAFVPGGPDWPGAQKSYNANYEYPSGSIDDEIDYFLGVAMDEAKIVAEKAVLTANTGVYKTATGSNQYFEMFGATDMKPYPEILLWRQYNLAIWVTNTINQWTTDSNCAYGTTKSMVDAFLMSNGLPVYAAGSGYSGDSDLKAITDGRDSRAYLFIKRPGDENLATDPEGPGQKVEGWPRITDVGEYRYTTGYTLRKGLNFNGAQNKIGQCTVGSIVFRSVEALLNYIEACYEKTGAIDATADKYWRQIRKRAMVNEDYNVTIAATDMAKEAETDWGAYSAGKLVDATLYNIRRERRCEFIAEGFRGSDIRRWRAMDQMIQTPYHVLGINLWENENLADLGDLIPGENVSEASFSKYLAPYHIYSNNRAYNGYRWNMAHYLEPIAIQHFLITGNGVAEQSPLYQNPGWPLIPNEGPR